MPAVLTTDVADHACSLAVDAVANAANLTTPAAPKTAGRQLDDVNGRLASIEKGVDMKQDMIKRNQTRIGELLREVRCAMTGHHTQGPDHGPLWAMALFRYCN